MKTLPILIALSCFACELPEEDLSESQVELAASQREVIYPRSFSEFMPGLAKRLCAHYMSCDIQAYSSLQVCQDLNTENYMRRLGHAPVYEEWEVEILQCFDDIREQNCNDGYSPVCAQALGHTTHL